MNRISPYELLDSENDLLEDEADLLKKAREAMQTAHCPYSEFQVGAAIKLKDETIVTGSNQENAAYPSGICAERAALFGVGSQGKKNLVLKLAVIGKKENSESDEPVTPCGACRQVIKEYEDLSEQPIVIIMAGTRSEILRVVGIENLLPWGFGPKNLGFDIPF